jgi:hypothetical protein
VGAQQLTSTRTAGERVVSERAVVAVLAAAIVALNVANAVTIAVGAKAGGRWLLLALERNPSTWFSAAQLALAAVLALAVGRGRADADRWRLVAGILLLLSVDEVATFHEKLGGLPVVPGIGDRAWTGAGLLLAGVVALRLLPWALRLEPALRLALLLGGAVFVVGAVGFEALAATWAEAHGEGRAFWVISSIEEDFELLGVFVVVRLLLAHLRATGARVTLAVG